MDYLKIKEKGVDVISKLIENKKPFSVTRIGLGEIRWIDWFIRESDNSNYDSLAQLYNKIEQEGVYGNCAEYFFSEYTNGISSADVNVFWQNADGSNLLYNEQINIFNKYSPNSIKVDIDALSSFKNENHWSKKLEGKKVLIIYPFIETIKSQYTLRDQIWTGNHYGKLPEFDLKTYKPVWSLGGCKPHSSWKESLEFMKREISDIEFDIALLGCSHYGIPLCGYIKDELQRSAIYLGGEVQILFGIKGARWDQWPIVTQYYNEYWTRAVDEVPVGHHIMDGGCYW